MLWNSEHFFRARAITEESKKHDGTKKCGAGREIALYLL